MRSPSITGRGVAGGAVPLSAAAVAVTVLGALAALAVVSGAWLVPVVLGLAFLVGVALLAAGGDEPLTASQAATVGLVHLLAGAVLAVW